MTVVVGVRGRRGVLLAGDSQWSTLYTKRERTNGKTFGLHETVAVAYCGSARLGQILTFHLEELEPPRLGVDELRWAVRTFVPFLREACEEHGHLKIWHNVERLGQAAFLLAVRGRLFTVEDDLQVGEDALAYCTLGSGEDVAIGAMQALVGDEREPIDDRRLERVALAGIEAASEFTNFVGGDITSTRTILYTDAEKTIARNVLGR